MSSLPLPIAAFLAGLISFLSPCVLPLVPGYLSLISGAGLEELKAPQAHLMKRVMVNSIGFILGFSVVFIALGAAATEIGQVLGRYKHTLARGAGVVIILFGLHLTGIFKIKALYTDARLHSVKGSSTPLGAFVIGFAFAFGWTRRALSADVAFDGALPQVLQPLPLAHARPGSGIGRLADRARSVTCDRPL